MEFQTIAGVLSAALFLSLSVERVVQFVIRPLLATLVKDEEKAGKVLPYLSALLGGLVSWGFGLDLFAPLAAAVGLAPAAWITKLFTALVVSGGSNLLHDLWPSGGRLIPVQLDMTDLDGATTRIEVAREEF
jgi:hypothetical protein